MGKKYKEIQKLSKEERAEKLKELRFELVKKGVQANKSSKIRTKEIKKAIARILTLNVAQTKTSEGKK